MTEQGVRPARGRLSPGTKRRFPCVEARVRTFRRGRGREAGGRGKKPNTKTKRSLTVCIIDALKKSRAPRHMCPSPAAVRRYPNVALALMVGRPAAAATPFAAEAVTSLFEQQNWKFRRQTNIIHGWKGSLKSPFCSPCPTRVLYTGGRILAWTPSEHEGGEHQDQSILEKNRRDREPSRGGKLTTTERMAKRRGEHTRQGTARHGTARNTTCWVPQDLPGGFPVRAGHACGL